MKHSLFFVLLLALIIGCKDTPNQPQGEASEEAAVETSETGALAPENAKAVWSVDTYREKGMEYAMATQGALGKTLQNKIQEDGIQQAMVFCKEEALPITDSLSRKFGANISRITDRPRNPLNAATAEEMKFISNFKSELSSGQNPEALVVRQGDHVNFYYPILTNNLCLKCHGTGGEDIQQEVLTAIEELYPQDLATGYTSNELRGLWKVSFEQD